MESNNPFKRATGKTVFKYTHRDDKTTISKQPIDQEHINVFKKITPVKTIKTVFTIETEEFPDLGCSTATTKAVSLTDFSQLFITQPAVMLVESEKNILNKGWISICVSSGDITTNHYVDGDNDERYQLISDTDDCLIEYYYTKSMAKLASLYDRYSEEDELRGYFHTTETVQSWEMDSYYERLQWEARWDQMEEDDDDEEEEEDDEGSDLEY